MRSGYPWTIRGIDQGDIWHPTIALISKGFEGFQKGKVPTFLDSGASDMMFILRDAFVEYKPLSSCVGDSAKAKDGGFEIVGEGNVNQRYKVGEGERNITYTWALHTPTLNANLVSISTLNRAGLTTTFGNGEGIIQKSDGTTVLAGKNVNRMYLLETLDTTSHTPLTLNSLSQLGINTGDPGVFLGNPYPYLSKPTPMTMGRGFNNEYKYA